ncbi:MAG: hypothetical protein ABJC26_05035 [Gemmatimonadaceae bacterium]
MLSTVGKIAAVVTMLGGAALLQPKTASAMAPAACTEEEIYSVQCGNGDGAWCGWADGNAMCVSIDGCLHIEEPGGGYHLQWVESCTDSGGPTCPGSMVCG